MHRVAEPMLSSWMLVPTASHCPSSTLPRFVPPRALITLKMILQYKKDVLGGGAVALMGSAWIFVFIDFLPIP